MEEFKKATGQEIGHAKNSNILVVDINYLPAEFKKDTVLQTKSFLEELYKVSIFLLDGSRQNTQGVTNNSMAVYSV